MMASVRMIERVEGRGAPALLLHAAASTGEQWRHLAQRLAGSHSVVVVDLLGEGKSPPVPAGAPILETELALLEERLCALEEPVALVGHSYGGLLALELARRRRGASRRSWSSSRPCFT